MATERSPDDAQHAGADGALQFRKEVADLAHDLRAPFNTIVGFSEALVDGLLGELSATQKEYIGEILAGGLQLLSMVDAILASAKAQGPAPLAARRPQPGPVRGAARPARAGGAVPAQAQASRHMALVVEDDDRAADLMRLLLEGEGFSVVSAFSAEEAFFMAPLQPLDLITLDIQLPGVDGWEFLHQIRTRPGLARVPVLIVSAEADVLTALSGGASALLLKPVSRRGVQASLAELGLRAAPAP